MATFHIQDPREKENVAHPVNPGKQQQQHQQLLQKNHHNQHDQHKEKRPTLAILSNVEHVVRGHQGKLMIQNNKTAGGGCIEKHAFASIHNQQQQQKKILQAATTKVTTEQSTKPFIVYEDIQQTLSTAAEQSNNATKRNTTTSISITNVVAAKTISISNDKPSTLADHKDPIENSKKNLLASAIRGPLKEVKTNDGLIETPMSVSEILSPMSVDKSNTLQNTDSENLTPIQQKSVKNSERLFEVDEYQEDILEYYREIEKKHRPKPGYMRRQPDVNNSMRTVLVDWLVEVAEEYRLHTETLYLAVSYIDRFLSYMSVVRAKLQLVGTAAMFIAAKYEEIYPPDVGEFVFITDDTYTKAQVLRMEQIILKILSFDLNVPSPPVFLNIFGVMHDIPDEVKFLAIYLSELTLLEGEPFLQYIPSQISSASLALARHILNLPIWCKELETITKYSLEDLKEIILNVCQIHNESLKLKQQAIQEKYKSRKYMEVSMIKPIELDEEQLDYLIKEYNNMKMKNVVRSLNNE